MDAIIVAPCDTDAVSGALESASGEIPVFFIDQDADFPGKTSFVGTSNVDAAKKGGQYVGKKSARMQRLSPSMTARREYIQRKNTGLEKKVSVEFRIEPIAEMSGNNVSDTRESGRGGPKPTRFNNEIGCCPAMNDDTAIGAPSACQDAVLQRISRSSGSTGTSLQLNWLQQVT